MKIIETKNELIIDEKVIPFAEQSVVDIQPKKNFHNKMEVQVTFLVDSFIKE